MMHVVQQSKEEKIAMYMKLTKKELAEMLYNCNVLLGTEGNLDTNRNSLQNSQPETTTASTETKESFGIIASNGLTNPPHEVRTENSEPTNY